jgi:hypothetical protein
MAAALKNALPSHLKSTAARDDNEGFTRKHHGKSQSNMVSASLVAAKLIYVERLINTLHKTIGLTKISI